MKDEESAESVVSDRIPAMAWVSIAILLLLTISSYVDRAIISLMVDPIKRDLGISDVQVSLLQGFAFALVFALASIPMGWLSDRLSRRAVVMAGVTVWSLATMACGMAHGYWQLFIARFGVGIGEAALPPSAYGIIADQFPKRRLAMAIGLLAAGTALGTSVAYALGGLVIGWAHEHAGGFGLADWQLVFLMVGLPGLILMPLVLVIPKPKQPVDVAPAGQDREEYFRWLKSHGRYVVLLAMGVGCYAAVAYAASAWVPSYLLRRFGLSAATIGLSLGALHAVAGLVGFVGSGWLVDGLHARGVREAHFRYLQTMGAICGVIGVCCFTFVTAVPVIFILLGLLYTLGPVTGPALGHVQLSTPARFHGRTVALFQLIMNLLAMITGPSAAALFSEKLFGGPEHIGLGLAATFAVFSPLGFLLVHLARTGGRRAMQESQGG